MSMIIRQVLSDSRGGLILVGVIVSSLILVLMLLPWRPDFPDSGLDPSWKEVIEWGLLQGQAFGRDLIFTFGPLGFLYTRLYHPELFGVLLGFWFVAALLLGLFFGGFWGRAPWPLSLILVLGLLLAVSINRDLPDSQLFLIPLAGAILGMDPVHGNWRWLGYPLLIMAALAGLIKFTVFMAGAAVFTITDLVLWWRERILPHRLVLFLAMSWVCFYLVTGHGAWPAYLLNSLQIAGGYSAAMQTTGPLVEIKGYLIMGGLLSLVLILTPTSRQGSAEAVTRIGVALASLLIGFLMFKAGVVRHDGHILITAGGLLLLAVIAAWRVLGITGHLWLKGLSLGTVFLGTYQLLGIPENHSYQQSNGRDIYLNHLLRERPKNALHWAAAYVFGRSEPDFLHHWEQAHKDIRERQPLPSLEGRVDIYNWDQAVVLANGLTYAPRPIFQSYSAYSPALLQMNANHLASDKGPDYILFAVQAIDNRLPALEDGLSWPVLLTHYDAIDYQEPHLLLKRRHQGEKALILGPPQETRLDWDAPLAIGSESGTAPCIWASVHLRNTLAGRLITTAYKAPMVEMTVELTDGSSQRRRFIPGMGPTGFLLNPFVEEASDFDSLCMAKESPLHRGVKTVSFHLTDNERYFFKAPLLVTTRSLQVDGVSEHLGEPSFTLKQKWRRLAAEMLQTQQWPCGASPAWKEGRIFAHADCELRFSPGTAKSARIDFGYYDEALRSQETDGVRFQVRGWIDGDWKSLAARELKPSSEPDDRQDATFDIDLPQGVYQIQLLTTMIGHSIWDWAYWGPIDLRMEAGAVNSEEDKSGHQSQQAVKSEVRDDNRL